MITYDFALQTEIDGEVFYRSQAEKFVNQLPLHQIFEILADVESKHARLIRDKMADADYILPDHQSLVTAQNVFAGLTGFAANAEYLTDQLDTYRHALDIEQKSLDIYLALRKAAQNEKEELFLDFLIAQEKNHSQFFTDLIELVSKPVDWVEAAEFGTRSEY